MPVGAGSPEAAIADFLNRLAGRPLAVAVSGGGDSMALLHLLAGKAELAVVTINHGLRPEAAAEAAAVAAACARLGVPHETLQWRWDGTGNLSDAARRGRMALIAGWALARGVGDVALGHTADDQAETFLLRLARGSGVDGLSAMSDARMALGLVWHRPLLGIRREALRDWLTAQGVAWFDDPTNDDTAYQRVRARAALVALEPLGISVETLNHAAALQAMASGALRQVAADAARRMARIDGGDVLFDPAAMVRLPDETQLRLLAHAVMFVSSAIYRPRLQSLADVHADLVIGRKRTLGGCLLTGGRTGLRVTREWQAVKAVRCDAGQVWDRRWRLEGPQTNGLQIAALGAVGLAAVPDWRATGVPRATLLASPAVWQGGDLVAAPLAGQGNGWRAELAQGPDSFFTSLLSH